MPRSRHLGTLAESRMQRLSLRYGCRVLLLSAQSQSQLCVIVFHGILISLEAFLRSSHLPSLLHPDPFPLPLLSIYQREIMLLLVAMR